MLIVIISIRVKNEKKIWYKKDTQMTKWFSQKSFGNRRKKYLNNYFFIE